MTLLTTDADTDAEVSLEFLGYELKVLDWADEVAAFFQLLFPLLRDAALAGAETALEGMVEVGVGIDWAQVNQAAVDWARSYAGQLSRTITGTTQNFVRQEVAAWLESGERVDVLKATLEPMFGSVRAEMIAVTETTTAFAEGNLSVWRESGVVEQKQWRTARDELVCPICTPLDGLIVDLEANGFTTDQGGIGLSAPPAHVRCRCFLSPVLAEAE